MNDKFIDRVKDAIKSKLCISKKVLAFIFIVVFIVSLIPITITMFYSVPVADDYSFGESVHSSVMNGGTFINGVIESCNKYYYGSQGFFSINLIASSQLFNLNIDLYFISNIVFFYTFIASLLFLSKVVILDLLKANKIDYILISIPLVEIIIQFIPSAAEGIYWMDGSLTLFCLGLFLFLLSFIILYDISSSKSARIVYCIMAMILSAFLSGCSFQLYVTFLIISLVSIIYCILKRKKTGFLLAISFVIYTIGILISVLSPGNQVRLSALAQNGHTGLPFITSIIKALLNSFNYFNIWTNCCFIALLLFLSIVFWNIAKETEFSFKKPLLVFVICYAVYSSRFSIQLFAMGNIGSPRQMNEYYIGYIICITISWLYFIGWISKNGLVLIKHINKQSISAVILLLLVFLGATGLFGEIRDNRFTSYQTAVSFLSKETQQYNKEMKTRIELYENTEILNVKVESLSVYPVFFMKEQLSTDENYWSNKAIARYYNKESVKLIE